MAESPKPNPYWEPPEGGVGGEGSPFDLTSLEPKTDPEMEQGIRVALFLELDSAATDVTVRVEEGIAYIGGQLATPEERARAEDAASRVHGIRRVVSQFTG